MGYVSLGDRELRTEAYHHCPEHTEIRTALALKKMSQAGSKNKLKIGQTPKLSMIESQGKLTKLVPWKKVIREISRVTWTLFLCV